MVDSLGRPMSCGGRDEADSTVCFVLDREEGEWLEGPSMGWPRRNGGDATLLSDGTFFVSGSDSSPA